MKKKPSKHLIALLIFFLILLVLLFAGLYVLDQLSNKPAIRAYCQETREFAQINQSYLETLFTTTFSQAEQCQGDETCMNQVSQSIFSNLEGKSSLSYFPSTYFLRASENSIEKLFLSGKYVKSQVTTPREIKVLRLLQGKRGDICDDGFKFDQAGPTDMTYLNDYISEAEVIIPVKKDGKVIGAVIKLWGD